MKTICLDDILSQEEIKEFEEIYFKIKNSDMTPYQKKWSTWKETADWVKKIENKDLFLERTVGKIQKDILNAYEKLLMPYIKKGIVITPILGTLLGFYRNGDLIKHDDDLDLGIDIFDYKKIKKSLWLSSLFNGWKLHTYNWFDNNGNIGSEDHAARLFQMKETNYVIGNLEFRTRGSIDLWPISKVPNIETIERDRNLYYIHLQNIYKKNQKMSFFNIKNQEKYLKDDIELKKYSEKIFNDTNSILESEKWLKEFYFKTKLSKEKIYIPLEKDMPKINNINLLEHSIKNINGLNFMMPKLNDDFFIRMYGPDWNIEKITHMHFVRFSKIKQIKNSK